VEREIFKAFIFGPLLCLYYIADGLPELNKQSLAQSRTYFDLTNIPLKDKIN
jgi:hypothetical protein